MSISIETLALAKKNTKQAVEEAVTSVYKYRGSVETLNDLPTSGQKVGDVYNVVSEAGQNYAWDGSNWDALGIAENLGDIEFKGEGIIEKDISFDGNDDRITYSQYVDCSKAISLENLASNQILITCEGANIIPSYVGFAFSNSSNSISLWSGSGEPVQNIGNNQYIYTIPNGYTNYKYFFLPLTTEKRDSQGQSLGVKIDYWINPVITYKTLEQVIITKTINNDYLDKNQTNKAIQTVANQANTAYSRANSGYNLADSAYTRASSAYSRAGSAFNKANTASNTANSAYNAANVANNSLNDLGNVEFPISSVTTTVTKDLTNDKTTTWGVPIRAREVQNGKITIKVTNNQDMPTIQYPSSLRGGYGPTPQQAIGGPGGGYTPSISSNVDEYIFTIDNYVIQNDYYIFIKNEVTNMGSSTGFSFQGTLSYETETPVTHTINDDYYDKDATNSLTNDTLNAAKAYTDSKFDISLKKEIVQTLPAEGEEDILYLVPKIDAETEDIYDEYIWTNNDWEKIGSTATDLNNYYDKTQIDNMRQMDSRAIEYAANTADNAYDTANAATNLAQAAYDAANSLSPAAWQEISNVTTNEATNSVILPIDKEYDEYLVTFNKPFKHDGPDVSNAFTNENPVFYAYLGNTNLQTDLSIYPTLESYYKVEHVIQDEYIVTGVSRNNIKGSPQKDFKEELTTINDITNSGVVFSTLNGEIEEGITMTVYGKGGQETE